MSKIKLDFILNNLRFDKNMQGDKVHDDARRHNDVKNKITSNSNIGDFSGSLQCVWSRCEILTSLAFSHYIFRVFNGC
jgi:hypothetical protein